jgi:hypothetical protein
MKIIAITISILYLGLFFTIAKTQTEEETLFQAIVFIRIKKVIML